MCGIAGILGKQKTPIAPAIAALSHRGPDEQRTWSGTLGDRAISLGQARLRIIDLSEGGRQPMWDDRQEVGLVYNGELYNYRELRRELEALGHTFRSQSDTEVVLRGYLQWDQEVVHRLRGMFAFAFWDARRARLFLARDRLGIKPLYYAQVPGGLAFASEIKGLFALGVPAEPAPEALDQFLTYLYIPGPGTAYRDIFELPPAHRLSCDGRGLSIDRYWALPEQQPASSFDVPQLVEELRSELEKVVEQHLLADVPLGAFLSGGLDSSTLVGLMSRRSARPVKTFCMTFGEGEELYDERLYAREAAAYFGTEHTEIPVKPDLVDLLPKLAFHFDQPFGNPTALLTYELSRLTRQHVTVALAGDGGDEIFLGYPRYQGARLAQAYARVPAVARRGLARGLLPLLPESSAGRHSLRRLREFVGSGSLLPEQMYRRWVGYFSADERARLLESPAHGKPESYLEKLFATAPGEGAADRASAVDLQSFLPNNLLTYSDRMSMAHGLELRVPYCDHVLVEKMARVPARIRMRGLQSKWLFKQATKDLLPRSILRRKKLGFNPPMGIWLNRDLKALTGEVLSPAAVKRAGRFKPEAVAQLLTEHRAGRRDFSLHIWALLVFETWCSHEASTPVLSHG